MDLVCALRQTDSPALRPSARPAQLRSRARLSAASGKYSYSLTEKQRDASIAAGAKLRSRPRLGQSGPLTGQQYSIRRQYALQKAHGNRTKTAIAPQVPQPQKVKRTTWEPHRDASGVAPERYRMKAGPARKREDIKRRKDRRRREATTGLEVAQKGKAAGTGRGQRRRGS